MIELQNADHIRRADVKRIQADEIVTNIVNDLCAEAEEDDRLGVPKSGRWYFITPEQHTAIVRVNGLGTGTPSLIKIFDYDMIITTDPSKTGRQRDAFEVVSIIDTYPDYPRVLPR